jgi:hypothetical protein
MLSCFPFLRVTFCNYVATETILKRLTACAVWTRTVKLSCYFRYLMTNYCGVMYLGYHLKFFNEFYYGLCGSNIISKWNLWKFSSPPADTRDRHGRRRPSFGRFCTFKVTCHCEPVSFSRLLYASVSQTVFRSCPPAVSEDKALQRMYQTLNEWKLCRYMSVLKLPLLVDLQQKVGELVLSITSCPAIIILESTLN